MADMTPRQQFGEFLKKSIAELEHIDSITPWQEVEPDWWLKMSALERQMREHLKSLNERRL